MQSSILIWLIASVMLGLSAAQNTTLGRTGNLTNTPYNGLGVSPIDRHVVNATQAQAILDACTAEAEAQNVPYYNIAVVDPGAYLVAFLRQDSAFPASIELSIKKAKTVSLFNGAYSSKQIQPLIQPGGVVYGLEETNGGLVAWEGGLPLIVDGIFIGAVGVSGGSEEQDKAVVQAGLTAIGASYSDTW